MADLDDSEIIMAGCLETVDRCREGIASLTDTQFRASSGDHDSIGAHLRHCHDYFICFLDRVERAWGHSLADVVVDYDRRAL